MDRMMWPLALLAIVVLAITGVAQQRDSTGLSLDFPVPAWPASGVIPPELKSHCVFVDAEKNEYVVAYPDNLGSPNFEKDGPSERHVSRYKLQRGADPAVAVAVSASSGGKYKYAYTIFNSPKAKQSIDQWILLLPDGAGNSAAKQPAGWFGLIQKGRTFTVVSPDWIKSAHAAVFAFEKTSGQIAPGDSRSGFELESDLKPGFTLAYFRPIESLESTTQASGNIPQLVLKNATPPPTPGAPPAGGGGGGFGNQIPAAATAAWQPIKDDIEKLLRFEYNSKALLTLAPKFDKSATDKTIASDFLRGITVLSQAGTLSADSAFVEGTLSDLDAYLKAGGTGQLKLNAQPKNEVETQVFNAIKASLHIN